MILKKKAVTLVILITAKISWNSERITEYGLYHKGASFPFPISSLTNGVSQMLPTS